MSLTTYCPDTPQTRARFEQLKAALEHPRPHKPTRPEEFNEALQQQISRENKALRQLRAFLPGHEPDRFVR